MSRSATGGAGAAAPAAEGLLVVDKPGGWTSHDVVARVRRLAGTRRVGHAGTLDPMATGVLVLGLGRATRLLGHLAAGDKEYAATIRLGQATTTDDADGEVTTTAEAGGVSTGDLRAGLAALTGALEQVPSSVSAIKVAGRRAYARVRAGETVELAARPVTVHAFELLGMRPVAGDGPGLLDVDVRVVCSAGTYVRALARDLGAGLGVGGHLTALRRTRVGRFGLAAARTLDELAEAVDPVPLADAVAAAFPRRDTDEEESAGLRFGRPLDPSGREGPVGAFAPDGTLLALLADSDGRARPLVVFDPA